MGGYFFWNFSVHIATNTGTDCRSKNKLVFWRLNIESYRTKEYIGETDDWLGFDNELKLIV